jgi:molybdopterin molybdotransferase
MLGPWEARAMILGRMAVLEPRLVGLEEALARVLAESIVAGEDLPPFVNSAMDGFALGAADAAEATPEHPVRLRVIAEAPAGGAAPPQVRPGTAVRVMTGARLPEGADCVVPVEQVQATALEAVLTRPVHLGQHIRRAGEDVHRGETVLEPGVLLRPAELGLLAALGRAQVRVVPPARVAVITTGDELVDAGSPLGPGQIRDANLPALCAQVRAAGAVPVPFPRVPDRPEALEEVLRQCLSCADVILTNGGVSMGDFDHVRPTLERLGAESLFWQVAQKPGRPMAFSLLGDIPVFGIPGNPVAAQICFEEFVRPALRRLMGHARLHRPERLGILAKGERKPASDSRVHFLRVWVREEGGRLHATSTGPQGSGLLSSMTRANALAILEAGIVDPRAGDEVMLHLTDEPEDH